MSLVDREDYPTVDWRLEIWSTEMANWWSGSGLA